MNFFLPLFIQIVLFFGRNKFQIKYLKALGDANNEIEIKFGVQRVNTLKCGKYKFEVRLSNIRRSLIRIVVFDGTLIELVCLV